jgi:O-antigen/teichoic acid export membrane protein
MENYERRKDSFVARLNMPVAKDITVREPSLIISFIWTFAGSIAYSGTQWSIVVLLAKLGTPALVGQYAFATAIAYPLYLGANLSLRQLFVNDRDGTYSFDRFLGLRYVLLGVAWTILVLISLSLRSAGQSAVLVLVVGSSTLLDSVSEAYYSILQKNEHMDRIARSEIFRCSLGFGGAVAALYYTSSVVWAVIGLLAAKCVVLIMYDSAAETFRLGSVPTELGRATSKSLRAKDRFRPRWDFSVQRKMFMAALPLGSVAVLVSFNGNVPRYIIEHYLGPRDLGIYSALSYLPQAGTMIASTLGYVTYARLGKLYHTRDVGAFKKLLRNSVLICASIGLAGLLCSALEGKTVLAWLYRPEYAEHEGLLLVLTASSALAFVTSCFTFAITAASQFRQQIPLFIIVVGVSSALSFILVPRIGVYGGALATLVSIAVQLLGTVLILRRALADREMRGST